jgi:hypothetical protein
MTDPAGGTEPLDREEVHREAAAPIVDPVLAGGSDADAENGGLSGVARDPVAAVKDPDNRAKLLLALAAMTLLNLILLIVVLANVVGGDPEPVNVEGRACIIREHEGASRLFCAQ